MGYLNKVEAEKRKRTTRERINSACADDKTAWNKILELLLSCLTLLSFDCSVWFTSPVRQNLRPGRPGRKAELYREIGKSGLILQN